MKCLSDIFMLTCCRHWTLVPLNYITFCFYAYYVFLCLRKLNATCLQEEITISEEVEEIKTWQKPNQWRLTGWWISVSFSISPSFPLFLLQLSNLEDYVVHLKNAAGLYIKSIKQKKSQIEPIRIKGNQFQVMFRATVFAYIEFELNYQ